MRFKFLLPVLILTFTACKKKTSTVNQATEDKKIIEKYISDNKLSASSTSSGLYYVIENAGSGVQPNASSTVVVKYKGYLTDGTVFDESSAAEFGLTEVIKGWQEGIPLFKKGGKGKLLIPSSLGYGAAAQNKIPANSVLIFDIELLNVKY